MSRTPDEWLEQLGKLAPDRRWDRSTPHTPLLLWAPHKPLLLLMLLDQATTKDLPATIELTKDLKEEFETKFQNVARHWPTQKPKIYLPFYHLENDGIWVTFDKNRVRIPDVGSRSRVRFAQFDASFLIATRKPTWREQASHVLITTWFQPDEFRGLYDLFRVPPREDGESPEEG